MLMGSFSTVPAPSEQYRTNKQGATYAGVLQAKVVHGRISSVSDMSPLTDLATASPLPVVGGVHVKVKKITSASR